MGSAESGRRPRASSLTDNARSGETACLWIPLESVRCAYLRARRRRPGTITTSCGARGGSVAVSHYSRHTHGTGMQQRPGGDGRCYWSVATAVRSFRNSAVLGAWLMGMHCSEGCRASGGSFREIARLCSVHPEGARSIGQASTAHRLNCLAPRPEEPDWLARLFCLSLCPAPTTC